VITNPSAEFSPEGSAGIINLISKKTHKPGGSGSVRASLGNGGRREMGLTAAYNSNKLTLSADASGRWDPQSAEGVDLRTVLDGQGHQLGTSRTLNSGGGHLDLWAAHGSLDYDLDPKTRVSGDLRFSHLDIAPSPRAQFEAFDPSGAVIQAFDEPGHLTLGRGDTAAQASLRKTFAGDDHTLLINLSREHIDDVRDQTFNLIPLTPPGPSRFTDLKTRNGATQTELKADYARPMPADGKLKAGYDLRIDDNRYENAGVTGATAAGAGPDPGQSSRFLYKQTIDAAYATYEQPFGDWTVLGGLRLEGVALDLAQVTTAQSHDTRDVSAYPSLHLADRLSDAQQLSFSYSRRVQRPAPEDLNPFRVSGGASLNFQAGNPDLKPQTTDSFEAGYQYRTGGTFYLATLYYRRSAHGVTDVLTALSGGVLLTTKENLSNSQAAGLELVANGHVTKTLTYNLSTDLRWNEIDATGQGLDRLLDFAGRRSAFVVGGRASLTWQPTPKDTFQVSANLMAKRLTPQGYNEPTVLIYLGYRHKFADDLFGIVTVQDPFDDLHFRQVIDTPVLRDRSDGHIHIRGLFVGVTRTFGGAGKKPHEPGFDFGGGAG
jgi:outer membrane receptor protein involved in Fe transport